MTAPSQSSSPQTPMLVDGGLANGLFRKEALNAINEAAFIEGGLRQRAVRTPVFVSVVAAAVLVLAAIVGFWPLQKIIPVTGTFSATAQAATFETAPLEHPSIGWEDITQIRIPEKTGFFSALSGDLFVIAATDPDISDPLITLTLHGADTQPTATKAEDRVGYVVVDTVRLVDLLTGQR